MTDGAQVAPGGPPSGAPGHPWRPALVPAEARPGRYDVIELLGFVLVFALALATPARDAAGQPNAPLMTTLATYTGGGLCLYRRVLGVECGGCGLTRGFVQLAHGHPGAAVALNPMTPVVFAWCAWHLAEVAAFVLLRRRLSHGIPIRWVWRLYGASFLGFVIVAAYRLVLALTGA